MSFDIFHPPLFTVSKSLRMKTDFHPLPSAGRIPAPAHEQWVLPYIDQPLSFWTGIAAAYGSHVREVYFPLSADLIGSGEPPQPSAHLKSFLESAPLPHAVLLNPVTLPCPAEVLAPRMIEALRRLIGEYGLDGATVVNLTLARRVREALPDLPLTASCLMQISTPNQIAMLDGVFDALVPCNSVMRDLPALRALKAAFPGRLRLLVNEGCLPGCPFRVQHFHEMGSGAHYPESLCRELLTEQPWLRLTGGWVLPQHLHLFTGVYDDLKLGGRVTLRSPEKYLRVLDAYVKRQPLKANEIGCGPGTVLQPIEITEEYYAKTLVCRRNCHHCSICRDYYGSATQALLDEIASRTEAASRRMASHA